MRTNISARCRAIGALCITGAALLGACSSDSSDEAVAVTGTDESCDVADGSLAAGPIDFEFTNESDDVSELYVLRENGDVVSEVENVTTGTSRTLSVDLVAGAYMLNCKPGQRGDGFSTDIEVTGEGGESQAEPDRTETFEAVDFGYQELDLDVSNGETIRFEMTNDGAQAHEFEVLGPDGEALGEVAAIEPGAEGGATLSFEEPGEYTYQCILVDPETGEPHTALGMVGSFTVSEP